MVKRIMLGMNTDRGNLAITLPHITVGTNQIIYTSTTPVGTFRYVPVLLAKHNIIDQKDPANF
jgi:hypothetical protein